MELKIVKFFNRLGRGTAIDLLTRFVSNRVFLGVAWAAIAIAIFFLDLQNGIKIFIAMTVAICIHFVLTAGLLKHLLRRYNKKIRPYVIHTQEIIPLGRHESDSSFPSSHMSANVSLIAVVVYFYPVIWPVVIVWTLFMAFARLHNGMHYPNDIIAGAILGILYGTVGIYFSEMVQWFDFLKNLV